MRKKRFKPYGIDIEYEQRTYRYVGRDYGNSKNVSLGFLKNVLRFFRKMRNRQQKTYAICNTYTEWERHVKKVVNKDIINSNDLIHWLYHKRNFEKQILEAVKAIVIPLYLAMLTTLNFINMESKSYGISGSLGGFIVVIIMVFLVCFEFLYNAYGRVNFYNDFIRIAETELMDKQVKGNGNYK